jgi:hypothetical protein
LRDGKRNTKGRNDRHEILQYCKHQPSGDSKRFLFPFSPLKNRQRMALGIESPLVQRDEVLIREQKVKIFQPDKN